MKGNVSTKFSEIQPILTHFRPCSFPSSLITSENYKFLKRIKVTAQKLFLK